MSKMTWSKNQQTAIEYTSSNALVSAGAGSGKTAVLTERIYQLVKNGADLKRFLVLTFTNAASAEMKTRIRKKLSEDPNTKHLASKVDISHIETFDAFALFLVKKYAFRLGVSPNIKIIDNTLLSIEKSKIRDDLLTYLYQSRNSDFLELISRYCVKNDNQIKSFINDICRVSELMRDRDAYLDGFIENHFDEKRLNSFVDYKYQMIIDAIDEAIMQASQLEDLDDANAIIDYLTDIKAAGTDYDSLVIKLNDYKFPTKPRRPTSDADYRTSINKTLSKAIANEYTFGLTDDIIEQYMSNKKYVKVLIDIVKEIEHRLDAFKKEKNSYAFGDIANFALKALDISEICEEMKDYFQYILVDEYQDTSVLQELVINKLAKNNVYMVGDVKQSIYRFRFADCSIFQGKFDLYKKSVGGKLIDLNTSYRSRREIVDVVNEMFLKLMDPHFNPIDYKDGHNFEFGLTKYDSLIDPHNEYGLKIYRYPVIKGKSNCDQESEIMATDIINKINNKYQVYDSETKTLRDCTFKDFAIIIDTGLWFDDIKTKFSNYGIPIKVLYDEPVKDSAIAYVLKNLLVLFNCVMKGDLEDPKFTHAYVSIARSFLLEYMDPEIYDIVTNKKYKETELYKRIEKVCKENEYSPLEKVLTSLVEEFDVYRSCIKLTRFSSNTNKIELFINLAKSMDELGYSIDDLVQYFEDLNTFDLDIPFVDTDVSDDSVTLITIHRSKGLEYPIIYLPHLTHNLNRSSTTSFLIDQKYGAILPIVGNTSISSLFNHLIKVDERQANYEEKLRLLYVAITRARERVIMLYGMKENGDPYIINPTSANSYHDLIHYLGFENKYGVDFAIPFQKLNKETPPIEKKKISCKSISVDPVVIERHKASKDKDDTVNESLLEFGTEIHYLLEIADYETKDLSFIKNFRIRKYINNVLTAKVFENVKNNQVLHEYPFFDEQNGVSGVIDCLIRKDDEIDIVDFKLKHLDDEKYVLQLHTYRDYIKQITDLPIKMYLISAITGEVKEIE